MDRRLSIVGLCVTLLTLMFLVVVPAAFSLDSTYGNRTPITLDNADSLVQLIVIDPGRLPSTASLMKGIAWSPDSRMIASTWNDRVFLWDVETGRRLAVLDSFVGSVNSLAFSPNGALLASAGGRYVPARFGVQIWDVDTLQQVQRIEDFESPVYSVTFSPNGRSYALGYGDPWGFGPGGVQIRNVRTGDLTSSFGLDNPYVPSISLTAYSVSFSPDGGTLAAANGDGSILFWDVRSNQQIAVVHACSGYGYMTEFSPDGTRLGNSRQC